MARKSQKKKVYLALAGNGDISVTEAIYLIDDFADSYEEDVDIAIIIPALTWDNDKNLLNLANELLETDYTLEVLTDSRDTRSPKGWAGVIANADNLLTASGMSKAAEEMVSICAKYEGSAVVALWDDDDEFLKIICPVATEHGVDIRDLTMAFETVEIDHPQQQDKQKEEKMSEDFDDEEGYTEEYLADFDDDELLAIAKEDLGLKVRSDAKRETLIKRILEAAGEEAEDEEDVEEEAPKKSAKKSKAKEEPEEDDEDEDEEGDDFDDVLDEVEDIVLGVVEDSIHPVLKDIVSQLETLQTDVERLTKLAQSASATTEEEDDEEEEEAPRRSRTRRTRRR